MRAIPREVIYKWNFPWSVRRDRSTNYPNHWKNAGAAGPLSDLSEEDCNQRKEIKRREMGTWLVMIELISKLKGNIIVATSKHGFLASSVKIPEMLLLYENLSKLRLSMFFLSWPLYRFGMLIADKSKWRSKLYLELVLLSMKNEICSRNLATWNWHLAALHYTYLIKCKI